MSDSSGDAKLSKVISAKSQTAYERWEAPNVKTIEQQKQERAGVLTARQLEELQKQAYDEGFQQGKEEGHQAGFQQGHEEGRHLGILKGQEEITQMVKHFEQIMKFLSKPIEQVNQSVEEELISLSMATAKQIIRREVTVDPGQIIAVIKEALLALPSNSKKIKVYLHPSDAQIVRDYLISSSSASSNQENLIAQEHEPNDDVWSVIDEPNITRGGCQIKSEFSQIDASIDTRIAEIAARILGSERESSERAVSESVSNSNTVDRSVSDGSIQAEGSGQVKGSSPADGSIPADGSTPTSSFDTAPHNEQ